MIMLIFALFLATIITRIMPAFLVGGLNFPQWLITLLNYIPYAALGVLIFPGLLSAVETPVQGILGGLFAMMLALFRIPLFFIVSGAIVFVYFLI
jgi:branched-subunit amino acid transport protein